MVSYGDGTLIRLLQQHIQMSGCYGKFVPIVKIGPRSNFCMPNLDLGPIYAS